ncbi:MAG: cyclic nucleotide-binding domain-containing protein [Gammaproteobacteria bacterium]|nr:cyclic nucleotide-binding domain-containing protein [Gammaproteobacteria bacterium]MCP5196637.1 cyclic nucleotide-binding domain-containing protein [Gammaproteobacteria bacterium]
MQMQDMSSKTEEYQSFTSGQIIFPEGAPGDDMYIVAEGQVNIVTDGQIIETIEPGGIFGEIALIDNQPRSAAAIARTDCLITPINRAHFLTLIQRTPPFAIQVMRVMANRLRRANQQRAT